MTLSTRFCLSAILLCSLGYSSTVQAEELLLDSGLIVEIASEGEEAENPFEDSIETDRDSFTRSPSTVGKGRSIIEGSWTYLEQPNSLESHLLPDLLFRYGATKRLELRLGANYEVGKFEHLGIEAEVPEGEVPEDDGLVKENLIFYGVKLQMTEEEGFVPESSVIVTGTTPVGGDTNDSKFSCEYAFGYELSGEWELDAGLRFFHLSEEGDWFYEWAPSVVLKKSFGKRFNAHLEYFGQFTDQRAEAYVIHYLSPGAHVLVTPNLEVGVRLGFGLNEQSPNFFLNLGSGLRF